jgi:hypothetical protein
MNNNEAAKLGDTYNVIIDGDVNAPFAIGKGNIITHTVNERELVDKLLSQNITKEQANELIAILKEETQDTENRTLGTKAKSWCDSIKTVGLNVLSNLIFTAYYGLPSFV